MGDISISKRQPTAFSFDYPKTWRITTETSPVMHYRDVHVALNSFGRDRFQVHDFNTAPNTYEYGNDATLKQMPAGAVYLDVATWEGPPPPPDFMAPDTSDLEISVRLDKPPDLKTGDKELRARDIEFRKGGRNWSIFVYERAPFGEENSSLAHRILNSMRFEPAKK
jgi:hypothetical protein